MESFQHYLAVASSSSPSGSLRQSIIPRFILAGSSAQLDKPMKATLVKLFPDWITNSSFWSSSSSRGCRVFKGIFGESSANPISSSTTTEAKVSEDVCSFLLSWSSLHCLNVASMPSGVDWGLHWYETNWIYNKKMEPLDSIPWFLQRTVKPYLWKISLKTKENSQKPYMLK